MNRVLEDPSVALTRQLLKLMSLSTAGQLEDHQSREYFALLSQYEKYAEDVHCDLLTEIVKDVFVLFHPKGHVLNHDDLSEVMEIYFEWVLHNQYSDQMVPFEAFETWFGQLGARIVKAKLGFSDFSVDDSLYARKSNG
eukprot:gene1151-1525_t